MRSPPGRSGIKVFLTAVLSLVLICGCGAGENGRLSDKSTV